MNALVMNPQLAAEADASYDGLKGDAVFCTWTGHNPLSSTRAECLLTIYGSTFCPVLLLTPNNFASWQLPEAPFHRAFPALSAVHKADYLRIYMMHHFGGGYTDIKRTSKSWKGHFQLLRNTPEAYGLGYTEIGPHGVSPIPEPLGSHVRANYQKLIGNCAYIFRKRTAFTQAWFDRTTAVLDAKLDQLMAHPAQHPMDQTDVILPDGRRSSYPLRWAEILGEIFHPLVFEHNERFLHADIAPQFHDYR